MGVPTFGLLLYSDSVDKLGRILRSGPRTLVFVIVILKTSILYNRTIIVLNYNKQHAFLILINYNKRAMQPF